MSNDYDRSPVWRVETHLTDPTGAEPYILVRLSASEGALFVELIDDDDHVVGSVQVARDDEVLVLVRDTSDYAAEPIGKFRLLDRRATRALAFGEWLEDERPCTEEGAAKPKFRVKVRASVSAMSEYEVDAESDEKAIAAVAAGTVAPTSEGEFDFDNPHHDYEAELLGPQEKENHDLPAST